MFASFTRVLDTTLHIIPQLGVTRVDANPLVKYNTRVGNGIVLYGTRPRNASGEMFYSRANIDRSTCKKPSTVTFESRATFCCCFVLLHAVYRIHGSSVRRLRVRSIICRPRSKRPTRIVDPSAKYPYNGLCTPLTVVLVITANVIRSYYTTRARAKPAFSVRSGRIRARSVYRMYD